MRVAHIIWALGTGGAETMLVDIANIQCETENVAIAIVLDMVDETLLKKIDSRVTIRLFNRKKGSRNLMPWIRLNLFLHSFKPDIIHFHLDGMRKMVFHPAPKVFTIHNVHTSGLEYPKFDALYAISDGVKNYTRQQGFESTTVWNGIKTDAIKPREGEQYKKGMLCKIVCVGRLYTPHKGQDILIDALHLLKQKGVGCFHLDMIGDGESREALERQIAQYAMNTQLTILGQRDRTYIYQHLCDYDLFVLPSRSEGFGLSVVEAMCAKVPVIVCDQEGAMDVIGGGKYGRYFATGDADSLADQIDALLEKGADDNQIEEAYQYAIVNFDINWTAKRYLEEYRKVIERTKS